MRDDDGEQSGPLQLSGKHVVLLLQGGGALGAYQVGAFCALDEACRSAGTALRWVGGISIGAVNAAVIAAPRGGDPAAELDRLWAQILSPAAPPYDIATLWQSIPPAFRAGWLATLVPKYASWDWTAFNPLGQPHFFGSRVLNPFRNPWFRQWAGPLTADELAFYDTSELRKTLDEHVDWTAIERAGSMRLSLGATRAADGEAVYFNSFASQNPGWGRCAIRADHVLASAALPPAFPGIRIDGELYWDGGVTTNSPIAALAEDLTADLQSDTIVFLIDLWDRKGPPPRSIDEVVWRQKCIQYGSRKEDAAMVVNAHELAVEAHRVPAARLEVCQVMLEAPPGDAQPSFAFADADFTRQTYEHHRQLGYDDLRAAVAHPDRVRGVGGAYAMLYRHGTYGKHRATDGKYLAARERRIERMRAHGRTIPTLRADGDAPGVQRDDDRSKPVPP